MELTTSGTAPKITENALAAVAGGFLWEISTNMNSGSTDADEKRRHSHELHRLLP